jgi:MFS family permease
MLAALQVCASASGVVTTALMLGQQDRARTVERTAVSLAAALQPFRDRAVRGLLIYVLTWNLAVGVAGSFFALYMLQDLRMGFTLVAIHGTGLATARVLAAPLWGRLIDRLGARPVLIACAFGVSLIPMAWLFATPSFLWPLVLDAVMAGVLWGGHNLAMFVVPMTATPRRGRPFYIAAIAMAGGITFSIATTCGGALATALPRQMTLLGHPVRALQIVFGLSALMRFAAAFAALRIHEPAAAGVSEVLPEALALARRRPRPARRAAPSGTGTLAA